MIKPPCPDGYLPIPVEQATGWLWGASGVEGGDRANDIIYSVAPWHQKRDLLPAGPSSHSAWYIFVSLVAKYVLVLACMTLSQYTCRVAAIMWLCKIMLDGNDWLLKPVQHPSSVPIMVVKPVKMSMIEVNSVCACRSGVTKKDKCRFKINWHLHSAAQ